MKTQVSWKITLKNDRSGKHDLEIKILNYDQPVDTGQPAKKSFQEIISLPSSLDISNFQSTVNSKPVVWADNLTIEVSEIAKKYKENPQNSLVVHCNFDEEEVISDYGDFAVVSIFHDGIVDLVPSSIEIHIQLPRLSFIRYYSDLILLKSFGCLGLFKFFGIKDIVGVYHVKKAEGPEAQGWDVMDKGREAVLKFKHPKTTGNLPVNFPNINFYYSRAAKPLFIFLGAGFSFILLHYLVSLFIIWVSGGH